MKSRLSKYVSVFTFFNTYEENLAFLDGVNVKLNAHDAGTITRVLRQSISDKKQRNKKGLPGVGGGKKGGRLRSLSYKDEWFIFQLYLHAGFTYKQIEGLCNVSPSMISDIVHSWAAYLRSGQPGAS